MGYLYRKAADLHNKIHIYCELKYLMDKFRNWKSQCEKQKKITLTKSKRDGKMDKWRTMTTETQVRNQDQWKGNMYERNQQQEAPQQYEQNG